MLVLGTWSFSLEGVEKASSALVSCCSTIDSVEQGINCIEENEKYGPCIVGVGGPRNSHGYLEMDAAIMNGHNLDFGAVTALRGFPRPVSVARAVMERCPHNMLTSDGARIFAEKGGFVVDPKLDRSTYTTTHQGTTTTSHDTLGLIAMAGDNITCGVSTSGMPQKHPGRIGDSALPGNGLYADSTGGAACCSGDGDLIMKYCPSFHVVQLLKQGIHPQEVCQTVVKDITNRSSKEIEIAIIAVNMKGEYGSGTTVKQWKDPLTGVTYDGFPYVVWRDGWDKPRCMCQEPCS